MVNRLHKKREIVSGDTLLNLTLHDGFWPRREGSSLSTHISVYAGYILKTLFTMVNSCYKKVEYLIRPFHPAMFAYANAGICHHVSLTTVGRAAVNAPHITTYVPALLKSLFTMVNIFHKKDENRSYAIIQAEWRTTHYRTRQLSTHL